MSLTITDHGDLLDDAMRKVAERRLLFALSRFDSRILKVELMVADENGPRGGVDKVCRVRVSLKRASDVVIRDRDANLVSCLSRVADRVGRAVARSIERSQSFDRTHPSMPGHP